MTETIGDYVARLRVFTESDALDFKNTGRAVFILEDGLAELPLPSGEKGEKGDRGEPGGPLAIKQVLNELTDGSALSVLQEQSGRWTKETRDKNIKDGLFVVNAPTRSGFIYTSHGWSVMRNVFGASENGLPTHYANVSIEPPAPESGVTLFAQSNELFAKKSDGSKVQLT